MMMHAAIFYVIIVVYIISNSLGVFSLSSEEELRQHRCCFTGHRPEKLDQPERVIRAGLEREIRAAVDAMSYDELVRYTMDNDFSIEEWGLLADLLKSKAPPSGMSKDDIDAAWDRFVEFYAPAKDREALRAFAAKRRQEMNA